MAAEGVVYNPDGTVTLTIDGTVRHLRRPKLREYRDWAERLRDLAKNAQADAVRIQEILDSLDGEPSEEELEKLDSEMEEAQRRRIEYSSPWTAGVVEQLSGKPLPDEVDDWPSWLVLDVSLPAAILGHWKKAPLAPGSRGTT